MSIGNLNKTREREMRFHGILIAGAAVALIGASASAETVGLGTTKGGLTA